jgi:hypothetical protein
MASRSDRSAAWPFAALVALLLPGCTLGLEAGVGYDRPIHGIDAGFSPSASLSVLVSGIAEDGQVVAGGIGGTGVGELGKEGGEIMAVGGMTLTYASRGFMTAFEFGQGGVTSAGEKDGGLGFGAFLGRGFVLGPLAVGVGPRVTTVPMQKALSVGGQARALLLFWR